MIRLAKSLAKEVLWALPRYDRQRARRPICLYATRRGGSTLLMQVIGANKGVRYYDEPFASFSAPYLRTCGRALLPPRYASQFTSMHPDEVEEVKVYVNGLLDGNVTWNNPWRFWNAEYDIIYTRKLLKILDAKALIDWIDQTFSVDTVYLTRHPVPVALSVLKRKWDNTSRAYLQDVEFCRRYLTDSLLEFSWKIHESVDPFGKAILNWCLENTPPLALLPSRPRWLKVTYEDLVSHPKAVVHNLAEALELTEVERMLRQVQRPSSSSKELKSQLRTDAAQKPIVAEWLSQVTPSMLNTAQQIMDRFDITLYRACDALPTGHWTRCRSCGTS